MLDSGRETAEGRARFIFLKKEKDWTSKLCRQECHIGYFHLSGFCDFRRSHALRKRGFHPLSHLINSVEHVNDGQIVVAPRDLLTTLYSTAFKVA